MSTITWSKSGRTLLMWDDTKVPVACYRGSRGMLSRAMRSTAGPIISMPIFRRSRASLSPLLDRHELQVLGARVVRARPDDLAVDALLDHVGGPARGARDHEERGEHRGGDSHHVVRRRAVPVEVREHLLLAPHDLLDALGDVEELHVLRVLGESARDFLDHLVARVGDRVDRVAEADDHLLLAH